MDIFNEDFKDFIGCLNKYQVEYMLVGGYAVILRGYSRSTGDMDIWINKTEGNFSKLHNAIKEFGLPSIAVPQEQFFSDEFDVFSFGKPPNAIDLLTSLKGVEFDEAFAMATIQHADGVDIRTIHLKQLIQAKKSAGRHKDLNDIENLPKIE